MAEIRYPHNIKDLQESSRSIRVRRVGENRFDVTSKTEPRRRYIVRVFHNGPDISATCTCEWAQHGGRGCSHVLAVLQHLAQDQKKTLSFWLTKADALRQRRRVLRLEGAIYITSRGKV